MTFEILIWTVFNDMCSGLTAILNCILNLFSRLCKKTTWFSLRGLVKQVEMKLIINDQLYNYKQLLDEVFVICRIIKVE